MFARKEEGEAMMKTHQNQVRSWFGFGPMKNDGVSCTHVYTCDSCGFVEEQFHGAYTGLDKMKAGWVVRHRPKGMINHYCCEECAVSKKKVKP